MKLIDNSFQPRNIFRPVTIKKRAVHLEAEDRTTLFVGISDNPSLATPTAVVFSSWVWEKDADGKDVIHVKWVEDSGDTHIEMFIVEYREFETVAIIVPETI